MRYYLKFKKEGFTVYTSHLDIMRLFKRAFKRAGIFLAYSQGFNPHPKMSFAQPLSLGYIALGEYLEFETKEDLPTLDILKDLSDLMPVGLTIFECKTLKSEGKTLAALAIKADYSIQIPMGDLFPKTTQEIADNCLKTYLDQSQIIVVKHQKKTGKNIEVDIKPMILKASSQVFDNDILLTCQLAAGSNSNLSPELLIQSFCEFIKLNVNRYDISVTRNDIYFN